MSKKTNIPERCLREERPEHYKEFNISLDIQTLLEEKNNVPWTRQTKKYHPSSIKGCKRSLYYDRIGTSPKACVTPDKRILFDLGHAVHGYVENLLAKFPDFESEVPVSFEPLNIHGHCDGVFRNEDWVLEVKSIGDASFSTLVRPKIEHVWQIHCYMFALDIPRCQLLYVNRSNGSMRLFRVYFDNDIWDQITAVIREVEECVSNKTPPAKEINYFHCSICKFRYTCEPDLRRKPRRK